jgi:acyl-CoA thioester hydrolase
MIRYPAPPASAVSVELEVPFHDIDLLEVVWHGHYPKYFEAARTALLRSRRLDAPDMRDLGYRFYVTESHTRHLAPMCYGDRVRVAAWFREIENRLDIVYEIMNLTRACRCAQASTMLVTTTQEGILCLATPAPILERLCAPGLGQAQ